MSVAASIIANEFSVSEEEFTRRSPRAFLFEQFRLIEAERKGRCAKFGVDDLWGIAGRWWKAKHQGKQCWTIFEKKWTI